MTGYGRSKVSAEGITALAEIRSVNSRFLELQTYIPSSLALREKEVKELIRSKITRGKITLTVTLEKDNGEIIPLRINQAALKAHYKVLSELKRTLKLREKIKLEHLLMFSNIIEPIERDISNDIEWRIAQQAIVDALDKLTSMRLNEGCELANDLRERLQVIAAAIDEIEKLSKQRILETRENLREKLNKLLEDRTIIDEKRLELELVLLADKLDITEECVRFRSHNKFFIESMDNNEASGRRLSFLLQEMLREANTIGAKANDASITHKVVNIKQELEKIREQLQNIE